MKIITGLYEKEVIETAYTTQAVVEELEKIKTEIEQDAFKDVNGSKYIFVNQANQIIDKYKAELKGNKNEP